jgi:hypothetical protein
MQSPIRQHSLRILLSAWVSLTGSLCAQSAAVLSTAPMTANSSVSVTAIGVAVVNSANPASIVLSGTAIQNPMAPNSPSEPIWLQVGADGKTQMKITTATGTIGETRPAAGQMESCTSTADSANTRSDPLDRRRPGTPLPAITAANCWSPTSWILPTVALANPGAVKKLASSLSTGTKDNRPALQLALHIDTTGHSARGTSYINTVTARNIYLDPQTLLPFAMTYSEFSGNNTFKTTPAEIDYSDYALSSGVMVPLHIVKKINGLPVLDISIAQVTVSN